MRRKTGSTRKKQSCDIALESKPRIVVAGAGAIGCFVGGLLAAAGHPVTLLVRPRTAQDIRAHGLTLTDYAGLEQKVTADALTLSEDPACLAGSDIVLVTVKSGDTAHMGNNIATHAPADAKIISLQNGTENAQILKELMPDRDVRAGMVPFNVVPMGEGRFHRASSGDIVIGDGRGALAKTLSVAHLQVQEDPAITSVQWGKFLINLNNAINALSGLTLQAQLQDREWRKLMADQWAEALGVLRAHNIRPKSTTPVEVGMIPWILRLPTPIFRRVAASMLTIDAEARSSMSHDLMMGRGTEIDVLQGQVIRMGQEVGKATPICALVAERVADAEAKGAGLPNLPVTSLRAV